MRFLIASFRCAQMHCRNYCLTISELCACNIIEIEHKRRYISPINVSFQMMTVSWSIRKNFYAKKEDCVAAFFFTATTATKTPTSSDVVNNSNHVYK